MKTLNQIALGFGIALVLATAAPVAAGSSGYTVTNFKSFAYPGADHTAVTGMSGNSAVGYYFSGYGNSHGFSYDGSIFKNLDYPHSDETEIDGANGNIVVGTWYAAGGGPNRGFVYDGSQFRSLDGPGAYNTIVDGMFGSNVVGRYGNNTDLTTYYFIYNGSTFNTLSSIPVDNFPELHSVPTNAVIINGHIYDGAVFYRLDYPGSATSGILGVSGGLVVGVYFNDPDFAPHYFIYDGSTFSKLALPDTAQVKGLSGRTVFGLYFGSDPTYRGFTAQLSEALLRVSVTPSNAMVISWPFPSTGWDLQQKSNFTGTNWVTPPETIANDGTNNFIIVNTSSGNRFFRLQQN